MIMAFIFVLWILMIGPYANVAAQTYIAQNGADGLHAFLLGNLNLIFYIAFFAAILGYAVMQRQQNRRGY